MSANKQMKHTSEAVLFKILQGSIKSSDYATFSLLVPESQVSDILEALGKTKNRQFQWTVCEEEIYDVQNIPTDLAYPIRSIGKIPEDKTSESELLDWLVHGDSFFSKKYVILDFMDEKDGGDGYTGKKVFEITKKEHMGFCDAAIKLYENSDGYLYLQNVDIIDRGQYLRKFGGRKEAVTDELLAQFEEDAREGAPSWADDNRHYALHN
jgi:hypothetical protein